MSPCSGVCLPRNRSSAQPAATYQGAVTPARRRATSPGVHEDDHRASRASISAGDNSMPPAGSCSLTAARYSPPCSQAIGLTRLRVNGTSYAGSCWKRQADERIIGSVAETAAEAIEALERRIDELRVAVREAVLAGD